MAAQQPEPECTPTAESLFATADQEDYPAQIHDPTHNDPLPPGTPVHVIGRIGITLLITPA